MQNSGDCPRLTWHHRCSFPIVHECAVDVDCGETKNKCCYNGCKLTCQTAVKRKHGKRHRGYTSKERKGGGGERGGRRIFGGTRYFQENRGGISHSRQSIYKEGKEGTVEI